MEDADEETTVVIVGALTTFLADVVVVLFEFQPFFDDKEEAEIMAFEDKVNIFFVGYNSTFKRMTTLVSCCSFVMCGCVCDIITRVRLVSKTRLKNFAADRVLCVESELFKKTRERNLTAVHAHVSLEKEHALVVAFVNNACATNFRDASKKSDTLLTTQKTNCNAQSSVF